MTFEVPKLLQGCLLRDFVKEDAEQLADIEYDPIVKKYVGQVVLKTLRTDFVRNFASNLDLLRGWAIEALPEGILAGRASVSKANNPAPRGTIELEIVIAKPFWGRRLGRQVATALIQYVFSDQRAVAVVAEVHPENRASLLLLEAFNFVDTGKKNNNKHLIFELTRHTYSLSLNADSKRTD